jgi:hypothetical protein
MGLISNLAKLGVAKKVYDELKKPENQAKIKDAMSSASGKARTTTARARTTARSRRRPPAAR